ncbi:hypothetical protein FGKAn22_14690 [Ferrigenium kumadai]|uniref:Putative Flp pilus-assembly TadG-like N-terminal domain-containing protein n=1 Tax=Ferrigenium kumadai TaxID=1682490 RepID=A0AAN1T063_9PROT|nr:pilus assembly protein TadG-related protein [Ferrigenium kumadai]BBI99776.1 hypothetical protein FGKAn22_14690 [Ferrigenium kumadai]
MKIGANLKKRQSGAVAVVVGIGLALFIGFLALVIDLGHLYLARTGQQNAADAAALSGAKELNGTEGGIDRAVVWAQKLTANGNDNSIQRNRFMGALGWEEVALPSGNIHFSAAPYSSVWKTVAEAKVQPAGLYFIKVDTETGAMGTWFAGIWNLLNVSTYGSAVAGRFMNNIAPLGLCALDPQHPEKWVQFETGGGKYETEYGYMRGVNYNFGVINGTLAGLGPGTELYLHPTASTQEGCEENEGSADFAAPFLCTGKSIISGTTGSTVWTNTGLAAGKSLGALNTRFDQYGSPLDSSLDRDTCPPDANIRQYTPGSGNGGSNNWMGPLPKQASAFLLDGWLSGPSGTNVTRVAPLPTSVLNTNLSGGGCAGNCDDNYGVLWSYNRTAVSGVPPASSVPETWSQLYPSGVSSVPATPGPTYTGDANLWAAGKSPYSYGLQSLDAKYYREPVQNGQEGRRLLNVVLVDCTTPAAGGICRPMTVLRVGKFFMQRTATNADGITGEFAGLLSDAELSPTIRLYR